MDPTEQPLWILSYPPLDRTGRRLSQLIIYGVCIVGVLFGKLQSIEQSDQYIARGVNSQDDQQSCNQRVTVPTTAIIVHCVSNILGHEYQDEL